MMLRYGLCLVGLVTGLMHASQAQPLPSYDLAAQRWEKRVVVVFAPGADHPGAVRIREAAAAQAEGFAERHMQHVEILGTDTLRVDGILHTGGQTLRDRFEVPADAFRLLLIGKDGGVKLDRHKPTDLDALFALIDTMPMRRQEMRRQKG